MPDICIDITIVDDLVIGEGPEQLQLMLEFSLDITNVNVLGCPANITIQDKSMFVQSIMIVGTLHYYITTCVDLLLYL